MKNKTMKNPGEVKAKLFANYLEQKVFLWDGRGPLTLSSKQLWERSESHRASLLLRTVEDLTCEEKEILIKLDGWNYNPKYLGVNDYTVMITRHNIPIITMEGEVESCINIHSADYLRSIGIALPITYLEDNKPVTLSVAKQIDLGFIKILKA